MLDTRFPRPHGDIGNPGTFRELGIPVRYLKVRGASPQRTVQQADPALLPRFIEAAQQLAREGSVMISTSCGFLARHQQELAGAVPVPVFSSSLLKCASLSRPGILSIDADSLDAQTLAAAGVRPDTPVQGVEPQGEFHQSILGNASTLDAGKAEQEVVRAAEKLVERHPEVAQIVLECANMPPYRAAIMQATGRPVHDIVSLLAEQWTVLAQPR